MVENNNITKIINSYDNKLDNPDYQIICQLQYCELICYKYNPQASKAIFFIASPINDFQILNIGETGLFSELTKRHVNIYFCRWQKSSKQAPDLNDIIIELHKNLANYIKEENLYLAGHCLGGVVALALMQLSDLNFQKLILLSTPISFKHFQKYSSLYKMLGLNKFIANFEYIPHIVLQIFFSIFNSSNLYRNIFKKQQFTATQQYVENWLRYGPDLSTRLFKQLIEEFVEQDILLNEKWLVNESLISLKKIDKKILLVYGNKDILVPYDSFKMLDAEFVEYESGHINYLVKPKLVANLAKKISDWL